MKFASITIVLLFGLMMSFQNCSSAKFDSANPMNVGVGNDNRLIVDEPVGEQETPPTVNNPPIGCPEGDDDCPPPTLPPSPPPPPPLPPENPENPENPGGPKPPKNPPSNPPNNGANGACGDVEISKVIVNVDHVELSSASQVIESGLGPIDLMTLAQGFIIDVPESNKANQIRLVLKPDGNKIVAADGKELNLKTPSQQNSGLKLLVPGGFSFVAGKSYKITAEFDPETKIVRAGPHCILKPVLKLTDIVEVSQQAQ